MQCARTELHETGRETRDWALVPQTCAEGASLEAPAHSGSDGQDPVAHIDVDGVVGGVNNSSPAGAACVCAMVQNADSKGGTLSMFSPQIREILRHRCSAPGDHLHRRSWNGQEGARRADWVSIIFSASPVTLAYSKWQFRAFLVALVCVHAVLLFRPEQGLIDQFLSENRVTARHFRFEATELRAGKWEPPCQAAIGRLSLVDNGCKVEDLESSVSQQGASFHLTGRNGQAISANGFSFHTASAPSDVDYDPVGFVFSFCSDLSAGTPTACPPEKWHVVGSAECLFTWNALQCFPVNGGTFVTSEERGVEYIFNLRGPPNHSFCVISRIASQMLGVFLGLIICMTNRFHTARVVTAAIAFFLNGVSNGCVYAVSNILNSHGTHQAWTSVYPFFGSFFLMGWGVCLVFAERRIFSRVNGFPSWLEFVLISYAFIVPLDGILVYGGGQSADWWLFSIKHSANSGVVLQLTFYIFIITFKRHVWHQALVSVKPDMDQYDQEWKMIMEEAVTQEAMEKIAELMRQFEKRWVAEAGKAQVVQRLVEPPSCVSISMTPFLPVVPSRNNEVTCLDQLYLQAHLVWPLCVKLVHAWAQSPGGYLMTEHTSTLQATSTIVLSNAHTSSSHRNSMARTGGAAAEADGGVSSDVVIGKRRWDGFLSLVPVDPKCGWRGLCSWNHVKVGGQRARVKWATTKKTTRAIEKVQRVYDKHVSRLVDLVRQSIVFHTLGDLATCLDTILHDPQVPSSPACSPPPLSRQAVRWCGWLTVERAHYVRWRWAGEGAARQESLRQRLLVRL